MQALAKQSVPVVSISGGDYSSRINFDSLIAIDQAVDYFRMSGCKRLALMSVYQPGPRKPNAPSVFIERFRKSLNRHHLTFDPDWVRADLDPAKPGAGWTMFREIWSAHRRRRPDALLVTDDILFRDTAMGILEARIPVPDRLSIVTHANVDLPVFTPFPVARYEFNAIELVKKTVDVMVRQMADPKDRSEHCSLQPRWCMPSDLRFTSPELSTNVS